MKRLLSSLLALLLGIYPATAAVVQIGVKDAAGTTRNFNVTTNTDITGNLDGNVVLCDQAAGTTCASVGTAGAPSTNALTIQAVTLGHGTAANAMRVELPTDGTGLVNAAQSGTWNITNISGTVSLPTGASTAALQPTSNAFAGTTSAASTGTMAFGAATTGAPTYTTGSNFPLSLDLAGNLRTNCVAGCAGGTFNNNADGVATSATNGQAAAWLYAFNGTTWDRLRDSTYGTAPGSVAALAVNSFVTNALPPGQATMANSAPVVLASNQQVGDPCTFQPKSNFAIAINSNATPIQLVLGVTSQKVYVCSLTLVAAAAQTVSLVEGTGSTCTSPAAVMGSTTAANGMAVATNGGLTYGSGSGTVAHTNTVTNSLCLSLLTNAVFVSGNLTYVQQ